MSDECAMVMPMDGRADRVTRLTDYPWRFNCDRCGVGAFAQTSDDLAALIAASHPHRCPSPVMAWARRLFRWRTRT